MGLASLTPPKSSLTRLASRTYKGDRTFLLSLTNPTNGATLGPQRRTIVTIVDDDSPRTVAANTVSAQTGVQYTLWTAGYNIAGAPELSASIATNNVWHTRAVAGVANVFTITAHGGDGVAKSSGGDTFMVELVEKKYRAGYSTSDIPGDKLTFDYYDASRSSLAHGHRMSTVKSVQGTVTDNSNGQYAVSITAERGESRRELNSMATKFDVSNASTHTQPILPILRLASLVAVATLTLAAGNYELHTMLVIPGGFKGHYYTDPYMSPSHLEKRRVDAQLNFNWDSGRVTSNGKDFVSVWWGGKIKVATGASYTFTLEFDDNARLYIDGALVVDEWDRSPGRAR